MALKNTDIHIEPRDYSLIYNSAQKQKSGIVKLYNRD